MLLTDTHFKDNSGGCCSRNERHAWRNGRPCGCLTADTDRRPDPRPLGLTDNCRGRRDRSARSPGICRQGGSRGCTAAQADTGGGRSLSPRGGDRHLRNRDYEDALVELYDLAISLGLSPFAAGAFIGEHSYSTPEMPVAEGRPDTLDLADARIFGGECARKLDSPGAFAPFHIKGNRPYKEPSRPASDTSHKASGASTDGGPAKTAPAVPSVPMTADGCPLCGECVAVCPTGAVSIDLNARKVLTDPALCIRCCACVRACPAGLRTYTTPFTAFLHEHCSARRDPETFL